MPKIAALRLIAGESLPLQRSFCSGGLNRDFTIVAVGKPVGPDATAGKIVRSELVNRQDAAELRRQGVGRVVVLVRALKGRDPKGFDGVFHNRPADFGSRGIQMIA